LRHLATATSRNALEQHGPLRVARCNQPSIVDAESVVQWLPLDE